jgi:predicted amidohydrolase YtcJ
MPDIKIFKARKIITMDVNWPEATHVAVRDGRILAVGGEDEATAWGVGKLTIALLKTLFFQAL